MPPMMRPYREACDAGISPPQSAQIHIIDATGRDYVRIFAMMSEVL